MRYAPEMVVGFLDAVFQQGTFKLRSAADIYHGFSAFHHGREEETTATQQRVFCLYVVCGVGVPTLGEKGPFLYMTRFRAPWGDVKMASSRFLGVFLPPGGFYVPPAGGRKNSTSTTRPTPSKLMRQVFKLTKQSPWPTLMKTWI